MIRETNNDGKELLVFACEISCEQTDADVDGEEILDHRWVNPREALDMNLRLDNRRNVIQAFQKNQVVERSVLHGDLRPE